MVLLGPVFVTFILLLNQKTNAETPTVLLPLTEDCVNTYTLFDELVCNEGHDLFRYTTLDNQYNGQTSCATCDCGAYIGIDPNNIDIPYEEQYNTGPKCCSGWAGTLCDVCSSVDVCPDIDIGNGTMLAASACTSNQMAPATVDEAEQGKKFSCYCGGGEDLESKQGVCNYQGQYRDENDPTQKGETTTRFDWVFKGLGTSSSPGTITLEMNAGIHGMTWVPSPAPGMYDYFYPIVWEGIIDECVITTGYCMDVAGSDTKTKQCYNYDCGNTEIYCPPQGLPECPGGANSCENVPGTDEKYQMHKCNILPASGVGFQISCLQEANEDGTFLCYYNQPGGYAPLSMTCNVGNCLYNNTNSSGAIDFGETTLDPPQGIKWQRISLEIVTASVIGFALFLEFIRRAWDMRKEKEFRDYMNVKTNTSSSSSPSSSSMKSSSLTQTSNSIVAGTSVVTTTSSSSLDNPLLGDKRQLDEGGGVGYVGTSSLSSGAVEKQGAMLSWHDMKLWVPAKASDQLSALQNEMNRNIVAFRNDLYGDLSNVEEGVGGRDDYESLNNPNKMNDRNSNGEYALEKQILRGVSGSAQKSSVTALMGPSGAGKTSLLDCLAARKPMHRIEGQVRVNGHICPPDRIRDVSGYVAQHDVLPGVLTVREHLLFHARLRCPPAMGDLQRRIRVDDLINTLGLTKCANTVIGNEFKRGLSGGEKRRVSVAEELVVEPGILFLDEPTTGLDSTTAMSICETLSDIARRGTTVLLSIHQPREDIFNLFDRVLVMCEGGRAVYEGSTTAIPAYLQMTVGMGLVNDSLIRSYLRQHAAMTVAVSSTSKASQILPLAESVAIITNQAEEPAIPVEGKGNKKVRRYNPADLILDAASCPKCQQIADAFEDEIFDEVCSNSKNLFIDDVSQQEGYEGEESGRSAPLLEGRKRNRSQSTWKEWLIFLGLMKSPVIDNFPPRHVASPFLQLAVLSERLVLTATRHPMLVALQYFGSLFLAVCLGFIFQDMSDDLYGVQDRFGVLFFIPFCLVLLGMSSLPVWRDEHILFTHEQANKRIYGFPAYFFSVLFFDLVLVRTIPPVFFAIISYPMIGLNHGCDECLIVFALVLVFTNIISALIAMVVGAFRFSTSFSNLIGALLALLFALFAGFLVNRKAMKDFPIYKADPMAYSYEALLINQFANQKKMDGNEFYYTINGSWCAKGLATVEASGNTLLSTFGFSNSQHELTADITALWTGALWCAALAFGVLVISSQAPYYSAAWQRSCQVNPFSIFGALVYSAIRTVSSSSSSSNSSSNENIQSTPIVGDSVETRDERSSSVISLNSETSGIPSSRKNMNQNRQRGGSTEGGSCASIDIPSEDELEITNDFPDKPRSRIVSFEDEDSSNNEQNKTLSDQINNTDNNNHSQKQNNNISLPENLASTLRWQLSNPLGTEGNEPIVGQIPPPMVLSFHDICLSVPYDYFAIAMAKRLFQAPPPLPETNPNDYVIESLSCYLQSDEALGLNVETFSGSNHAIVKQIMPKSWAHRNGVLPGDAVARIGNVKIKHYSDIGHLVSSSPRPVLIEFLRRSLRDVSAVGKGKHARLKPILKSVSGSTLTSVDAAPITQSIGQERLPAMVCGIMGPSGAGKTSLLDCLAGRKTVGVVTGDICINGRSMTPTQLRLLSGYVVQEDILPPMLSVRECLDFQALLRVPGEGTVVSQRVDAVLKRMKLVRNADTLIGNEFRRGISGGEKRRVSVAIELLSEPAILFLDEPTTGQDSSTAVMLCNALKNIAKDGTTVVMSIHQPRIDIFEMMTQIVFMTREGRVAYCGPISGLGDYINENNFPSPQARIRGTAGASNNPADKFLDIMNEVTPQMLVDRFKESNSQTTQKAVLDMLIGSYDDSDKELDDALMTRLVQQRGKHRAVWLEQLAHLSFRSLKNTLRNPFPFFLHGVTAVVAATMIGFVFKNIHSKDEETEGTQDRFGIMFFLVLYLSLLALTSLPIWREEQQLFIAERASGIYGTSAYVLSSMIFDVVPYRILPPLAFTLISYPLIDLNGASGHQIFFFLVLVACNLALSGLCMLIGVLTASNASANAAGSLAMLTSLLFCGYLLNKKQTPDSFTFLTLWSPGNYAYEALVYNEFDGLNGLYITSTIADSKVTAGPFTGQEIAHCFGFLNEQYYDLFVLLVFGGAYFFLVLVAMKVFVKEQR